jgi:NADH-quinone oxidoreductase subunit J
MLATYLFFGLALLAVLGALGLILFKHPMNGAMSFVVTLISLAGLYALLSAKLIFAIQLIVYAGALILFIIMFLNIQERDLPIDSNRWFYLAGGIIVVAPIAGLMIKIAKSLPEEHPELIDGFGDVKTVGHLLFTEWLLPFEIVSILLLVALVGAVVLAGKRGVN